MFSQRKHPLATSLVSLVVTFAFVFVGVFAFVPPKKAKAFLGIGDVTFTQQTVDIPKLIGDILQEIAEVAFSALKKAALQWITKKIQNSILGINDESGPGFIENWAKEMFQMADGIIGEELSGLFGANLCNVPQHFDGNLQNLIKINLGLQSAQGRTDPLQPSTHTMCKITTIVGNVSNIWTTATQAVPKLGHQAWNNWSTIVEPNGNEFGVYFNTSLVLQDKENKVNATRAVKAIANQGYTGKTDPKTGKVLVPGKLGADVVSEAFSSPLSGITLAQDAKQLAAAVFSAALVRLLNEGLGAAGVNVKLSPSQVQGTARQAVDSALGGISGASGSSSSSGGAESAN